jgi:hypothetical protein
LTDIRRIETDANPKVVRVFWLAASADRSAKVLVQYRNAASMVERIKKSV